MVLWWLVWLGCQWPGSSEGGADGEPEASDTGASTMATGDSGVSRSGPATGATGDTGPAGATGDTGPGWDLGYRCEALGPGDIEDIPVPSEACTYEITPAAGAMGAVVFVDAVASARIQGDDYGQLGASLQLLDDVDGDGFGELAVGRPGMTGWYYTEETEGEVWYFPGPSLAGELTRDDVPTRLVGVTPDQPRWGEGRWLELGDLTGDGAMELIVGSQGYNPTFAVPLPPPVGVHALEDVALLSLDNPGGIFFENPTVGDVDGDGQDDLLFAGHGSQACPNGGAALAPGPMAEADLQTTYLLESRYHVDDLHDPSAFTSSRCSYIASRVLWDLDGDGDDEVLVSAEYAEDVLPENPSTFTLPPRHGGFVVFDGGPRGTYTADDVRTRVYGECGGSVGWRVDPVGDVTGDGRPDLAVGASTFRFDDQAFPGATGGAVFIASELHRARGEVPLASVSCATIFGEPADDLANAGYVGDLDGDGVDDLAVSSPTAFGYDGAVYLFRGPVQGHYRATDADLIVLGDGDGFGHQLRGGVDLDGDGRGDLVVSTMGWGGAVYVIPGAELAALFP